MKTYRVAVVGLGHGMAHARLVSKYIEQAQCSVLCDVNPQRLESAATELQVDKTTSKYADVISDPDVDIVCINTPCHIHGRMVLAALDADKHVMVETPMENESMDRLWKIIRMAERRHLKVQMDCPDRWLPESVRMKQIIESGALGDIYYIIAEYIQDFRLQGLIDNVNFRPGYGVKAQEPVSAGAGIYALDTARWFAGEQFTEVFAYGNRKNMPARNVDDHDVALFRTASGTIARVQCSKLARRPYKEVFKSVWGTEGTVESTGYYPARQDSTGLYAALGQDASDPNAMHPVDVPPIPFPEGTSPEMAEKIGHEGVEFHSWIDFLGSIDDDRPSQIDVYEAARTCAGAIAVSKSKEDHRPILIPRIVSRHEELKAQYPLPYASASSEEL